MELCSTFGSHVLLTVPVEILAGRSIGAPSNRVSATRATCIPASCPNIPAPCSPVRYWPRRVPGFSHQRYSPRLPGWSASPGLVSGPLRPEFRCAKPKGQRNPASEGRAVVPLNLLSLAQGRRFSRLRLILREALGGLWRRSGASATKKGLTPNLWMARGSRRRSRS